MPKQGPRTTYKYSDESKAAAVRLSELPDVEIQGRFEDLMDINPLATLDEVQPVDLHLKVIH